MSETTHTAAIVSFAAAREAKTNKHITPRNFTRKPHDGGHDAPHDGAMTASATPHDDPVTPRDGGHDGAMTAYDQAARRLQSPSLIQWLRTQYGAEEAANILTGSLLLAKHIAPGEEFSATDVIKATVTDGISYRLLTDKCKPYLIYAGIWFKNPANKFQWVNWKKTATPANGATETANGVQMDVGQGANDHPPACKRNPIERLRQWQRNRYLEAARADVWKQVKEDGTVIAIPKPGQGAMTEKQKELHRKAAWADHEGKLKLRIDQGANKELAATIQREELAAIQQEKAILNQARILAAEKRAQRTVMWERTKPLAYLAVIAIIGAALYNGKPASQLPTIQANATPPVQGNYP